MKSSKQVATSSSSAATAASSMAKRVIFSLGIPGSGKTRCLRRRFECEEKVALLDLDEEMKNHPLYDPSNASSIYQYRHAYNWANDIVQRRFEYLMKIQQLPLIAIDGTGTHISRQKERIHLAKSLNYHTTLLHVHVSSLDIALQRNAQRHRVVPYESMLEYHRRMEGAVLALKDEVDEYILEDNTEEDDQYLRERWGSSWYLHLKTSPKTADLAELLFEGTHGALKTSR